MEINSVTDNPIVLEDEIVSGGNFHGEPVGMVMSYLNLAICGGFNIRTTAESTR